MSLHLFVVAVVGVGVGVFDGVEGGSISVRGYWKTPFRKRGRAKETRVNPFPLIRKWRREEGTRVERALCISLMLSFLFLERGDCENVLAVSE